MCRSVAHLGSMPRVRATAPSDGDLLREGRPRSRPPFSPCLRSVTESPEYVAWNPSKASLLLAMTGRRQSARRGRQEARGDHSNPASRKSMRGDQRNRRLQVMGFKDLTPERIVLHRTRHRRWPQSRRGRSAGEGLSCCSTVRIPCASRPRACDRVRIMTRAGALVRRCPEITSRK